MTFLCRLCVTLALLTAIGRPVQAEPITIAGTVVDAAGKPVADAQVLGRSFDVNQGMRTLSFRTDATGAFSFQTDPWPYYGHPDIVSIVLARKSGMAMALGQAKAATPLVLRLGDKPETRTGVVVGPEGEPLPNVTVAPRQILQPGAPINGLSVSSAQPGGDLNQTTDAQGRFSFGDFPPGLALDIDLRLDGFAAATVRITNTTPVTVMLRPEATIRGQVVVNDRPRAGVQVVASHSAGGSSTGTAADGTYVLAHLPSGPVRITVQVEGMAPSPEQAVVLQPGQTISNIDFSLTPGAMIRGKVTDEKTGQPVEKALVLATPPEGRGVVSKPSAADGQYELRLRPGDYRLACQGVMGTVFLPRVMVNGQASARPADLQVTVQEGEVVEGKDLTTRLPRQIRGQVLLPDGQPATGASIAGLGVLLAGSPSVDLGPEARFEFTMPDTDPPAETMFGLQAALLVTEPTKNLASFVSQDAIRDTLTITLQPAATVTLTVVNRENRPLPGYGVSVSYPLGEHRWTGSNALQSDAMGTIRFACLPSGIQLRLAPDRRLQQLVVGDDLRNTEFTLRPGEQRQLPPIVVDPGGRSLNVFVGDSEGKPVKGAQVYAAGAEGPAVTDDQGRVTLTKLPLKRDVMTAAVHPTEEWYAMANVDPDAGVWPGLLLKPPGRATGMLIARPGGRPLDGWQISCYAGGQFWLLGGDVVQKVTRMVYNQERCTTDAQGRWRLDNLMPGLEYQLIASHGEPGTATEGKRVVGTFRAAGGTAEQDVGIVECDVPEGQ